MDVERPRRVLVGIAVVVVLAAIAVTAYRLGASTSPAPARASLATPAPPAAPPVPTGAARTPEAAAVSWLQATDTVSWHDPTPSAWIGRVQPYVTGPAAADAGQGHVGSHPADWAGFTAGHCTQQVLGIEAVVPPEAPRTATIAYVQLAATLTRDCAQGPPAAPQPVAVTVEVTRDTAGQWKMNQQIG